MNFRSSSFGTLAIGLFGLAASSQAAPFVGYRASISARDSVIEDFAAGRVKRAAVGSLDRIVRDGLAALRHAGKRELAARYAKAWKHELEILSAPGLHDVGDHEPLSRFLADFYFILSGTLGKDSEYAGLLADLDTMNFVIPVVFAPSGAWRLRDDSRADRAEYRKHFVPFAGIVTYYSTLAACRKIAAANGMDGLGRKLCPDAALRLEQEMRSRVAPPVSDYVFNQANGIDTLMKLSTRDLMYRDALSLERATRSSRQ